jgi:hypothetical protein
MAYATKRNSNTTDDSWKAQGFLNFYLPSDTAPSGREKIGAVGLRSSKATENYVLDYLMAVIGDPAKLDARVKSVLAQLIVEFKSAEPAAKSGLKLPE